MFKFLTTAPSLEKESCTNRDATFFAGTNISKRDALTLLGIGGVSLVLSPHAFAAAQKSDWAVPEALQKKMYDTALVLAKKKVRGGDKDPAYKKPYVDAAFSSNIFFWDTCFIATYAKYHLEELPVINALDNFYDRQDADGFICREYTKNGAPFWSKDHPVSINPPLLAFAELEIFGQSKDKQRLAEVYPKLKSFYRYLVKTYRMEDGLFFSDALGSGMDNIERYPFGWKDDGKGIKAINLYPQIYVHGGRNAAWNIQGRSVDFSAQMALFAKNMAEISEIIQKKEEAEEYKKDHRAFGKAINDLCWDDATGFYYDLGYGQKIPRQHIGMFWVMLADVVPAERLTPLIANLTDEKKFWRTFPVATFPADQPGFIATGGYWKGASWAPTTYMVIRGLQQQSQHALAAKLAKQFYWCVAEVFKTTGTFWENYASEALTPGKPSKGDFCGWTALAPIAIYREFIQTPKT